MMKKRIVIVLLAFSLMGCVKIYKVKPKDRESDVTAKVETETNTPEEVVPQQEIILSRNDYIRETFAEYHFTTPPESEWLVKEEGPQKIAVIIKEIGVGNRPNISKLIFLEGESNAVLYLQINNQIIIDN